MKNYQISNDTLSKEQILLSAERTFSAWLRTSLAAMAGGIAIIRLVIFKTDIHRIIAHIIGEILIIWGCLLIIISAIDYIRVSHKLITKMYKISWLRFIVILLPLLIASVLLVWVTLP